jgi:2-methylcitrate dehydratase PrpD
MQGFVAQEGLIAAQLAGKGFTGADNFLEGDLGFFKLFARGEYDPEAVAGELGERFEYRKTMFKMYPCCGSAISSVEAVLELLAEHDDITSENARQVKVKLTPYSAHIVDSPLRIGKNPRVDGQYNVRYCVANALLRRGCKLEHFEADAVAAPEIAELVKKIEIVPDHALDERDETAVDLEIITNDGKSYQKSIDYAGGFPERPLTEEQRFERFMSYISYGKRPLEAGTVDKIIATVDSLETLDDVRALIPVLLW